MFGIDVSAYQKKINWELAKSQIEFSILRLGWIGNKNNHTLDDEFERNYSECKRLGIPVGVYVYCYSDNIDAVKSGAEWTVEKLKNKILDLPVYIDMEEAAISSKGKDLLTQMCFEFIDIVQKRDFLGGVYANRNWFDNFLNKDEIKRRYTTWIATYTSGDSLYKGEYDMWQNSSSGRINGIEGNVDTNYMYRDLIEEVLNKRGGNVELLCRAHIQDIGWTDYTDTKNGIGTENESKRLEAIQFKATGDLQIQYRVHVQDIGWQEWKNNDEVAGTTGESKMIEAIEIKSNKILEVKEHIENVGWLPASKGTEIHVGTVGKALRLEAFKINIL